ncbi:hypothetical protein K0038_02552 [Pseudomonas syringae]|uniref:hypothetical protein n=1 Tax=Pseudomonas syringae TaxID=317 RepID=UPI001CA8E4BB|nr:hypothetical protein [Pseudomonas syringae]MCI3945510.1 hypothetical protein [Pseudomonas syringae]
MTIDWSKAPAGTTGAMVAEFNGATMKRGDIEWIPSSITPKGQYQVGAGAWVDHEAPQTWNGDGLPPVGTVCEVTPNNTLWGFSEIETYPCVVLAYHADFVWIDIGVPGVPVATRIDKVDFRPIRTAEQIAADERLHKIRNALTAIKASRHFPNDEARQNVMLATVEAMIDSGFVQQVSK